MECGFVKSDLTEASYFATPLLLGKNGMEKNLGYGTLTDFEKKKLEEVCINSRDISQLNFADGYRGNLLFFSTLVETFSFKLTLYLTALSMCVHMMITYTRSVSFVHKLCHRVKGKRYPL